MFNALKCRWNVIRFIVMKNLKEFCESRFDERDYKLKDTWLSVIGLESYNEVNHEPCLDYLNLINSRSASAEVNLPTILRNSTAMCQVWL